MTESVVYTHDEGWRRQTSSLQTVLDRMGAAGGGRVSVCTGLEGAEIGSIRIPSGVELEVCSGSVLRAALEREAYAGSLYEALIESENSCRIGLCGGGTIDGRALEFMEEDLGYIYRPRQWRPRLICLIGCEDVRIRDLTLRNGAFWTLHPIGCRRLLIDGITIDSDLKVPNCDGIDPDRCRDVRITNCTISCADDCVVLKTTRFFPQFGPCERIVVSNCTLVSTSAALKIGTESTADFRDIIFDSCTINASSRGIAIQLRDQGNVENVSISNCIIETRLFEDHWWGRAEPLYITAVPRHSVAGESLPDWNPTGALGCIRGVSVSNLRCRGENGLLLYGVDRGDGSQSVDNVVLRGIEVDVVKSSKWPAGRRDLRPCDTLGPSFRDPGQDPGLVIQGHNALSAQGISDLRVEGCRIRWNPPISAEGYGDPLRLFDNRRIRLADLEIDEVRR